MTTNAPLIDSMMTACVRLHKAHEPDGMGGLRGEGWTMGAPFAAAIVKDGTAQTRRAGQESVTTLYTVTLHRGVGLAFHDVFYRLRDGVVFRVTDDSTDGETPAAASFQFEQVTAERWELDDQHCKSTQRLLERLRSARVSGG